MRRPDDLEWYSVGGDGVYDRSELHDEQVVVCLVPPFASDRPAA
jgi:hypothetical protein